MAGDSPLAALVIDFAFATAEQRTQLMLIERMGAMEDRMHAAELRAERLANMLLMSGGTAFNIGTGRTKSGHPTAENLSSVLGPPRGVS